MDVAFLAGLVSSCVTDLVHVGRYLTASEIGSTFLTLFLYAGSFQVPALESVEQGGISNHTEAALIHTLLSLLIKVHQFPF